MRRGAICTIAAVSALGVGGVVSQASGKPAAAKTLKLKAAASGALKFNKKTLHAPAGKVTIRLRNPSGSGKPHAVEIEGKGVEKESKTIQPGGRTSVSARSRRAATSSTARSTATRPPG